MAGLGYKTFTAGEILTQADFQGYAVDQTIMVFAGTAARASALGTFVSEGMFSYLSDTNSFQYYDGAAWQDAGGGAGGDFSSQFLLMGA
jgi:hypothetical protein